MVLPLRPSCLRIGVDTNTDTDSASLILIPGVIEVFASVPTHVLHACHRKIVHPLLYLLFFTIIYVYQ